MEDSSSSFISFFFQLMDQGSISLLFRFFFFCTVLLLYNSDDDGVTRANYINRRYEIVVNENSFHTQHAQMQRSVVQNTVSETTINATMAIHLPQPHTHYTIVTYSNNTVSTWNRSVVQLGELKKVNMKSVDSFRMRRGKKGEVRPVTVV